MLRHLALAPAALAAISALAMGYDSSPPGSLVIYPEYDNSAGVHTLLTLTNVSDTESTRVLFVYVDGDDCHVSDRAHTLTPNDTLTVLTRFHTPDGGRGFVYATAINASDDRISFNYLVGTTKRVDGVTGSHYSLKPFVYQSYLPVGASTDLNQNGLIDMDEAEYEAVPGEHVVPSFIGQRPGFFESELILIGLSGGAQFQTRVELVIYNDNEQQFSSTYAFRCWEKAPIEQVSPAFRTSFLYFTDHDPNEVIGSPTIETGWFRIWGKVASSTTTTIADPAILVAFVESIHDDSSGDIPFGQGLNVNAKLWAMSVNGEF